MKNINVILTVGASVLLTFSGFAEVWTATSGTIPDLDGKQFEGEVTGDIVNADNDNNILLGARYGTNHFVKVNIAGEDFFPAAQATYAGGYTEDYFISGNNVNLTGARALTANRTVQALRFNGGHALDLGGNTLTLESGGLMLGGNGTINNGTIITGSGRNLWVGGANNSLTVNAAITGSGGLDFQAAGGLTLGGANTFTGDVWLRGGALNLNSATALGSGTGNINYTTGNDKTISFDTDTVITRNIIEKGGQISFNTKGHTVELSGWSHNGGNLNLQGNGTMIWGGVTSGTIGYLYHYGGELRITGTTMFASGVNLQNSSGTASAPLLNIRDNGWFQISGAAQVSSITVNIDDNGKFIAGSTGLTNRTVWTQSGGLVSTGGVTVSNTSTMTQSGGLFELGSSLSFSQNSAYLFTGGTLTTTSISAYPNIQLAVSSTMKLDGGVIKTSDKSINLQATSNSSIGTLLIGADGAKFDVQAGLTVAVLNLSLQHDATVSGRDGGIVKDGDGLLIFNSTATYVGTGTHTFNGNIMVNSGTFQLGDSGANTSQWTFALAADGTINKIFTAAGAVTNLYGTINIDLANFSASGSENLTWDLFVGDDSAYHFNNRFALFGDGWTSIGTDQWQYDVIADTTWFTFDRDSGVLSGFGVIPEPSTVFLFGAGAALLALTVWRRAKN
ncbi:MAG: PEP-CTERM sorting domain-containing protein [Verrucomicrobiales bacterium]|jgi:hypothetical protein|nr:PEP-CTERM sorting domain-containing protein [Verrucomicrobiales bacterium]